MATYRNFKLECSKCKRPILLESVLYGINSIKGVSVTCAECLDMESKEFKHIADYSPEDAKEIEEWLKEVLR